MSILSYNGSAVIAMCGKNCVGIACDRRFGIQQQTLSNDFDKVFKINDKLFIGLPGLVTDMQTLYEKLRYRVNVYRLKEEREIKPRNFAKVVSSLLYEHRFGPYYSEPVIAGLEPVGDGFKPFICSMDLIGCPMETDTFVVSGSTPDALLGTCESLFRKDLEPEDLFETLSQALLNAVDRDCIAGWGATVHIITPTGVTSRALRTRQD